MYPDIITGECSGWSGNSGHHRRSIRITGKEATCCFLMVLLIIKPLMLRYTPFIPPCQSANTACAFFIGSIRTNSYQRYLKASLQTQLSSFFYQQPVFWCQNNLLKSPNKVTAAASSAASCLSVRTVSAGSILSIGI